MKRKTAKQPFSYRVKDDEGVFRMRSRGRLSDIFPPKETHQRPPDATTGMLFSENFYLYVSCARPWRTVRDAVGDLPHPEGTEIRDKPPPLDLHFGGTPAPMSMKRYMAIP